ncbi:MAG: tetratricopeptide repeat protein, partial [Myxococcales bacterium]|nr:tetratricopeptide repeat protein [Myxococcales bacterium]
HNVIAGNISAPPSEGRYAHRGVPNHVHRALLRGLSVEPDQRFPDMEALLTALRHDPAQRRRRALTFVVANLVGGATLFAAGIYAADGLDPDTAAAATCEARSEIATLWNDEIKLELGTRFAGSGLPYAAFTSRELTRRIDGYVDQWVVATNQLCESQQLQGDSEALALQRRCLDERRQELATFTWALFESDTEGFVTMAEHAVAGAEALPPIRSCLDSRRQQAADLTDLADPEQRSRVEALAEQLAQAKSLADLGRPGEGMELATAVEAKAREFGSDRIQIRALTALADFEERLGEFDAAAEHLRQAYAVAERGAEDWLRVDVALELIALTGFNLERPAEAAVWQAVADPLLARIGEPIDLRGEWWFQVGRVHMRASEFPEAERALNQALIMLEDFHGPNAASIDPVVQALGAVARDRGDHDGAIRYHQRLLDRYRLAYGPDHPKVAAAYGSLGHDAYERGDYQQALEHYGKALHIIGECFGEDSQAYASRLNNYAAVLERLGRLEEAEQTHRRLLADREQRYGADDVRVSVSLENLGLVLSSAGRHAEAAEQFERSLALRTAHYGLEHVATATTQLNLGYALFRLGQHDRARALYQQTLETWTRKLGEDHPDMALVHDNFGELELAEGNLGEARRHYERALALSEAALGPDAADLAYSLTGLAQVALAAHHSDEAITACERALRLREDSWLPPGELGQTQLTMSRALIERGDAKDRARARDLARLAVSDFARNEDTERLQAARGWLEKL